MAEKTGVAAVVDQAERLEIEPPLPLSVPIQPGAGAGGSARIGRPFGARNKVTANMIAYLRRNYADPLEAMASAITRSVGDLAAELECDKVEAYKLQLQAMRDLAPYIYAKVPANMKLEGEGHFTLTIGDEVAPGTVEEDQDGASFDIEGEVIEVEQ